MSGHRASPSPFATPSTALSAADAEFWRGRWSAAESQYRQLAQAGDPHAEAHLAVLLTYESRFVDAVAAAQTAVQQLSDSDTLARLTRALDWAGDVPAAVAAGEKAVAEGPVDVVAHDYLAEALSDAGLFDRAQSELNLAQREAGTRYERSEAAREWANYYRDQGQEAPAISFLEIAHTIQSGFPERSVELAREYLGAGSERKAAALSLLDGLLQPYAAEPAVLAAAGDAAFSADDGPDSERYYRAALAGHAGDPAAALGLAEDEMAVDRHPDAARTTLLAAAGSTPNTAAVDEYLAELDRLVLNRDPAHDLPPGSRPGLDAERQSALGAVNAYRRQVGLGPVDLNADLNAASEAHAYYVLFNWGQPALGGLGIHAESAGVPGFTGSNSAERDFHFGYGGYQSSEVINHEFTAAAAVEVWGDSVYHRFPIIGRETADAGYGAAAVGTVAVQVMDFGVGPPESSAPLTYPAAGQTAVPPAFVGNELPDPAPNANYPVGYPITITAGGADAISVGSVTMTGPGGAAVTLYVDKPGGMDLGSGQVAVLPKVPLAPGTTYSVDFTGFLDGRALTLSWKFTTAA